VPPLARASEVQAYKTAVDAARAESAQAVQVPRSGHNEKSASTANSTPKLQILIRLQRESGAAPVFSSAIYHDENSLTSSARLKEKPTIYEVKMQTNLINFELVNGVLRDSKIVDQGYLALGKKKLNFERAARSAAS